MFLHESLYLWNTRWRCLQTSEVPLGHGVDETYRFLCRYIKWFKRYCNLCKISKWRTHGSADPGKIESIVSEKDHNFLTNCSKVISEKVHFWYLMTHRWRCSQLWHGTSDHGVNEVYQVLFWLIKVWPRYRVERRWRRKNTYRYNRGYSPFGAWHLIKIQQPLSPESQINDSDEIIILNEFTWFTYIHMCCEKWHVDKNMRTLTISIKVVLWYQNSNSMIKCTNFIFYF